MLVTASYAIASLVEKTHLNENYVIPKVNDPRILPVVTQTQKEESAGIRSGRGGRPDNHMNKMLKMRFEYMYHRYLHS